MYGGNILKAFLMGALVAMQSSSAMQDKKEDTPFKGPKNVYNISVPVTNNINTSAANQSSQTSETNATTNTQASAQAQAKQYMSNVWQTMFSLQPAISNAQDFISSHKMHIGLALVAVCGVISYKMMHQSCVQTN
jgi:hypothetical protein